MYFPPFTVKQGRRNRGGQAPPSFAKCPFSGSKVPFSCVKNVLRIAFFCPKGTFENLNLCYFPENFIHFREKYDISRKFLGISGKFFSYLGKNYPGSRGLFLLFSLRRGEEK